jgi:hypothetical protein
LTIEELGDGSFFKDIDCITHDSRHVYASDTYNGRILKFDLEMNYLKSIGSHGQGPEEFAYLGGIACLNDTLYVLDCGTGGLKVFTADGDFVRSAQKEVLYIEPFLFCMDESKYFYLSSLLDTFPLVKYDTYMNRQFGFGTRLGGDEERMSDMYMLQLFGDNILSVKEDEPLVTLYSRQGEPLLNRVTDERGRSLRPLFEGKEVEWRKSLGVESEIGRAVIDSDKYKYIRYDFAGDEEQLLDLNKYPQESKHYTNDPDYADKLTELRKQYDYWFPSR